MLKTHLELNPFLFYRVVRHSITKAQKQIVAGIVYYVEVKMVESTCMNIEENDGKTIEECPANEKAVPTTCEIKVWSRQWMKDESQRLTVSMKCLRMEANVGGRQHMTEQEISEAKDLLAGIDLQVEKFNKQGRAQRAFR